MYKDIKLNLSENEIHALSLGHPIRITKSNLNGGHVPLCLTLTQMKRIGKVAEGKQKYTSIKMSLAALKRSKKQSGGSFFGSVGSFLKKTFTTPSGLLGIAGMIPSPISAPLKVASIGAKLLGHGVKATNASRGKATSMLHTSNVGNNINLGDLQALSNYHQAGSGSFTRKALVVPTGSLGNVLKNNHNTHQYAIDNALLGMGFLPHHIDHMKGSGVFSNIWSGIRKLGTILKPYIEKEGRRLVEVYGPSVVRGVVKHATNIANDYMGRGVVGTTSASHGNPKYVVKFTKPQLAYIKHEMKGDGFFKDVVGGNLITIGSVR